MSGAGFRVLGRVGFPYPLLARLPKRWFRLWLLVHHPRSPWGLPWLWWLSAGRGFLVSPEAIGVLHFSLLEVWYSRCEGEGWTLSSSVKALDFLYKEEVLLRRPPF